MRQKNKRKISRRKDKTQLKEKEYIKEKKQVLKDDEIEAVQGRREKYIGFIKGGRLVEKSTQKKER